MERLAATVATASALFVGTNLDDILVLAVLNASSRAEGRPKGWQIWTGQYIGIALLVVVSLLGALGLALLPENRTWLLGSVPLGVGAYRLIAAVRARRSGARDLRAVVTGVVGVAAVTVANGGDNVAAYTPVFRTSSAGEIAVTVVVFALGVALWCVAASWLVSHRKITRGIERWGHWLVPAVFILIGLYIFYKGGVLDF
jgi:cadmium resistance protein CadD (predicted permease)